MGIYVESRIAADLELVWERTQDPARHQRWDLRFTRISHLPRQDGEPQRFTYTVAVLPGFTVGGTGISAGERFRPDGTRTSALRFASRHPLSLIEAGKGYWRYVPDGAGVRFLTGYDYVPRWGRFGGLVDRAAFRPLMSWGTAWSFDRLRLWCEHGVPPERSLRRGLADAAARVLGVVLAGLLHPVLALPAAVAAVALPALPTSPSSRRCRRRPPARATAPASLAQLGAP